MDIYRLYIYKLKNPVPDVAEEEHDRFTKKRIEIITVITKTRECRKFRTFFLLLISPIDRYTRIGNDASKK